VIVKRWWTSDFSWTTRRAHGVERARGPEEAGGRLPEARHHELRERIRAAKPAGPDGSIRLRARAWAARGTKVAARPG
jgi:hypothetical protein